MEAVVARDGKEYIIEVNDCATTLMGESQEEDRKNIAELVLKEMEVSQFWRSAHDPSVIQMFNKMGSFCH